MRESVDSKIGIELVLERLLHPFSQMSEQVAMRRAQIVCAKIDLGAIASGKKNGWVREEKGPLAAQALRAPRDRFAQLQISCFEINPENASIQHSSTLLCVKRKFQSGYAARDSKIGSACVGQPPLLRSVCIDKLFKFICNDLSRK
jgi:hypothetical protein